MHAVIQRLKFSGINNAHRIVLVSECAPQVLNIFDLQLTITY